MSALRSLSAVLLDAQKAVRHLSVKDPQRIGIVEAVLSLQLLSEALGGLDIGARRMSPRRLEAINACSTALGLLAIRVELLAIAIECETEDCELAPDAAMDRLHNEVA